MTSVTGWWGRTRDRATTAAATARQRIGLLDHGVRTQLHYSRTNATMLAGGITYFGFLSFFPLLLLAFFVVGYLARIYPDAHEDMVEAISTVLPGLIGDGKGQLSLDQIQRAAATIGIIGALGALYTGLGWLSALRTALLAVFELDRDDQPGFVPGKLRDLITLATLGVILLVSVALSGTMATLSDKVREWLGWSGSFTEATVISVVIGLLAGLLLYFLMFWVLARPPLPRRDLWSGALVGAVAFEVLKWLATWLLGKVSNQPAFAVFGSALILLVWINYFSRTVMYAAAWAHTGPQVSARAGASAVDRG